MLQSQVNLDHRLAELRQVGLELRQERAALEVARRARSVGTAIRRRVGGSSAAGQPAGIAPA